MPAWISYITSTTRKIGITRRTLARRAGITEKHLSRLLAGKTTASDQLQTALVRTLAKEESRYWRAWIVRGLPRGYRRVHPAL